MHCVNCVLYLFMFICMVSVYNPVIALHKSCFFQNLYFVCVYKKLILHSYIYPGFESDQRQISRQYIIPCHGSPNCLHTTLASDTLHESSQTVPQMPSIHTSTLPLVSSPSTSIMSPVSHVIPLPSPELLGSAAFKDHSILLT